MVPIELLKRYHFFSHLSEERLKILAEIAEEAQVESGVTLFDEKNPATAFYFLIEGYIDLYQHTFDTHYPRIHKDLLVGAVHPREIFGLSAIVEPFTYHATARTAQPCHFIRFDGPALRDLIEQDSQLGYVFLKQITAALTERLMDARVELAAAWVESNKK